MNNKFDDPSTIINLNKWMIFKREPGDEILSQLVSVPQSEELVSIQEIHRVKAIKHNLYIPNRPNTLFWSLYVAYYGEAAYLAIGNKYGNVEISEKQKIMEFLKSNKKILKTIHKKITIGTTQEIMSDLMTNMNTSLLSVSAYAAYYKRNILLLNTINKTFIQHIYNEDITTHWIVIKYTDAKKYGVLLGDDIVDISPFITEQYICIETYDKPLKGMSTYKMQDLLEISSKLALDDLSSNENQEKRGKTIVKSELYGKIWQYCLWN